MACSELKCGDSEGFEGLVGRSPVLWGAPMGRWVVAASMLHALQVTLMGVWGIVTG
jgi:hypothetical protein